MPRGDQLARQWKIIQTLITSRRGKSAAELAEELEPDAAGYIKEKIRHDTQEIISQKDGSIVFEAEVAGTEEIKFWVMSWGS